jgi:1-phosphofructokinase
MVNSQALRPAVITITLNPALDRTLVVRQLERGAVNRAEWLGDRPGGKGVNVAVALAEHGVAVAALGFLGEANSGVFARFLKEHGVGENFVRLPGATREGLKIVDPERGETTDLNFPGLAPRAEDLADLTRRIDEVDTGWCVLAGSLSPGVPTDFYAGLTTRLRARGVRVALDTSGAPLAAALAARPDVIKPNVHELAELVGRELPDEAAVLRAARELAAGGVGLVAVSRGAEGALLVAEGEAVAARPPRIEVGSTVGAGDAMVAGIVAGRLRGLGLADTARLATAFSLHALTRGAAKEAGEGEARAAGAAVAAFAGRVVIEPR